MNMEARSTVQKSAGPGGGPSEWAEVQDLEMWVKKVASTSKKIEVTLELETEDLGEDSLAQVKSLLSMHQTPVTVFIVQTTA